jgi:hypothetical protein
MFEVQICFEHPTTVLVRGLAVCDDQTARIFMPFIEHCPDYVMRQETFALMQTLRTVAIRGIAFGMTVAHAGAVVYYDLAPGNVLMYEMFAAV